MDILFFAALAVFIFFKLREQFGKVDDGQKRDSIRDFIKEKTNIVNPPDNNQNNQPKLVAVPGVGIVIANPVLNPIDEKSQKILDSLDENLKADLSLVLKKAKLPPVQFLEGARSAFEIILTAFSIGDLPTLKPLLSEQLFLQFLASIEDRKSHGQFLNTKIISIDESKIINSKMVENFAQITIAFASKQINYIVDIKNEIVTGSKTQINTISDNWTFKKDCDSSNPNWLLSSTS